MSSQNYTEKAVKAAGKSLSEVARHFGLSPLNPSLIG